MSRDLVTAEVHAERSISLKQAIIGAQRVLDHEVFQVAIGKGSKAAVDAARADIQTLNDQLADLDRARGVSIEIERRTAEAAAQAERQADIADFQRAAKDAEVAAKAVDRAEKVLLDAIKASNSAFDAFYAASLLVAHDDRQRVVIDALTHRFEGSCIVGHLEAVGTRGLEPIDNGLDMIGAAREFDGQSVSSLIRGRIDKVKSLILIDLKPKDDD